MTTTTNTVQRPSIGARLSDPAFRRRAIQESGLLLGLILALIVFSLTAPNFATQTNVLNVLRQASFVGIIAMGMTLVIVGAEIDISVGSNVALSSSLLAVLYSDFKLPVAVAIPIVLVIGFLVGTLAGAARAKLNIPSFIVTLSLFLGLRGLAEVVSRQRTIPISDPIMDGLNGNLFGLPVPTLILIVVFAIAWFVTTRTTFGRSVYAVGGNAAAARLSGLRVDQVRIALFAITGSLAALVGVLLTARVQSGTATIGQGLEFEVIAAVIIGGTSLAGGRGSVVGTLIGVLFVTAIANALVLYGVNSSAQNVVRGAIVLVAVLVTNIQSGLVRQKN